MKESLKTISIIVILVATIICASIILYILVPNDECLFDKTSFNLAQKRTEYGWEINASYIHISDCRGASKLSLDDMEYWLTNDYKGRLDDINGVLDQTNTIIFNDLDGDNRLTVDDQISIYRDTELNLTSGDTISFMDMRDGHMVRIVLD